MQIEPLWRNLLSRETLDKLELDNGVTIPFIVGTYYKCIPTWTRATIESVECIDYIINDICYNINTVETVAIVKCGDIGSDIISILQNANTLHVSHIINNYQTSPNHSGNILYYEPHQGNNTLSQLLWDRYKEIIMNETFNRKDGKWIKFTDIESEQENTIKNKLKILYE